MNGIEDKVDKMIREKESKVKQNNQEKASGGNIEKNPKGQEEQKEESISVKNWAKIILWTLIGIVILSAIVYYVVWPWISSILGIEIPVWIGWVFQVIAVVFLIWLLTWIRIVGPKEHGIKSFLGSLGEDYVDKKGKAHGIYRLIYGYCKSGVHIVPRLPGGCGIIKIPKTRFELNPKPRVTVSKRTEKNNEKYGKQFLLSEIAIYTEFGRDYESVKNAIERETPTAQEALTDFSDSLIDDSNREAIGSMDWAKATEKEGRIELRETVKRNIDDPNSVFTLGGLNTKRTTVAVKMVDLEDKNLKKAMVQPDFERFQQEGAVHEAQRVKIEAQVIGEIRKEIVAKGFTEINADKIAHDIYELQVSKDLQVDTGMQVVKLIRFQSNSSLGSTIGEGVAAAGAVAGIMAGETMKSSGKSSEKEESSDKKKSKDSEKNEAADRWLAKYG